MTSDWRADNIVPLALVGGIAAVVAFVWGVLLTLLAVVIWR